MRAILTYHSIDPSGSPISIDEATFDRHCAWLTAGGVEVLPIGELLDRPDDSSAVAVTFDDAFLNTRAPLLRLAGAGLPVTVFAVSGQVGGTNAWSGREQDGIPTLPLMGWDDLEALVAAGVTVASHTRTHGPLAEMTSGRIDDELAGSRANLEARLDIAVDAICYPYGDADAGVIARAAAHYRIGCTTTFRALAAGDQALGLPRLDMYYFQAPGQLEAWGTPAFDRRIRWCQARRAVRARLFGRGLPPLPADPSGPR